MFLIFIFISIVLIFILQAVTCVRPVFQGREIEITSNIIVPEQPDGQISLKIQIIHAFNQCYNEVK